MTSLILDPLRGRQRLWIVFWLYWLVPQFLIERAIFMLPLSVETQIRTTLVCNGLYAIFSCVSLWRCAFNTDYRWLGYGARALAALNLLLVPAALYLAVTGDFGAAT